MIPTLLLTFVLVAAPAAAAPAADVAAPEAGAERESLPRKAADGRLEQRITLQLKDADLRNVLEKMAALLDATPIIEPGAVDGSKVSIEVHDTPVVKIFQMLAKSHDLSIVLDGKSLLVSKISAQPRKASDDQISDRDLLADGSLPRRREEPPPSRGPHIEIRPDGPGRISSVWSIRGIGQITLPGCTGPILVAPLGSDAFDGLPRLAFPSSDLERFSAGRIARAEAPFRIPECPFDLTFTTADGAAQEPGNGRAQGQGMFLMKTRLLEVSPTAEDHVLSAPKVASPVGAAATIRTGWRTAQGSPTTGNEFVMSATVLLADESQAVIALVANLLRPVDLRDGTPPQTIRLAHAEESLRVKLGQPERITVSSTWGRGRSALVLEIIVERFPAKS